MQEQILALQMKRLAFGEKKICHKGIYSNDILALKTKAAIVKLS